MPQFGCLAGRVDKVKHAEITQAICEGLEGGYFGLLHKVLPRAKGASGPPPEVRAMFCFCAFFIAFRGS